MVFEYTEPRVLGRHTLARVHLLVILKTSNTTTIKATDVMPQNSGVPLTTRQRVEYLWVSHISILPYCVHSPGCIHAYIHNITCKI